MSRYNWRTWRAKHWIVIAFIVLVGLPTVLFVAVSLALLAYVNWPRSYPLLTLPATHPEAEHITLIAHGLRDTTDSWSAPLKQLLDADNAQSGRSAQVIALDWNPYSQGTFRCSVDGMQIGRELGALWRTSSHLKSVHLIGHSCGAFVVLGVCKALRSPPSSIRVHSTYLDPVSIYGGWSWDYGVDHFGACADFSEAYIDTGDGVPGSNQLIPNTHTFDVTRGRQAAAYTGSPHVWPTLYYQRLVQSGQHPRGDDVQRLWQQYPKGVLEEIEKLPSNSGNW